MRKVVLLLLLVPMASAVEVQSEVFVDRDGDVVLSTQDGSVNQADPTGFYSNVDVVGGGVWAEDDDTVTFFLRLDDLTEESQVPLPFSDPDYYLYFQHGEQGYRVFVATALENPFNGLIGRTGDLRATLDRQLDQFRYQSIAEVEAIMDTSEEIITMAVPRAALVDENQAPLARNGTLHNMHVESRSMGWFGFPMQVGGPGSQPMYVGIPQALDVAPDDGTGTYKMITGSVRQKGSIFAISDDPIRWTNGEATTIGFQARLTNTASEDVSVAAHVRNPDSTWEVAFSDRITIPAASSINHTILVSIPFSHNHGATKMFDVHYASDDGDHEATTLLGVHWPFVPQPAGHHDTLWFHSYQEQIDPPFDTLFQGVHGWFSAKQELEEDEGEAVVPDFVAVPGFFGSQEGRAIWFMRLEPGLRMGLDFRPGQTGSMELGFNLPVPVVDPRVEVTLMHERPGPGFEGRGQSTIHEDLMSGISETTDGVVSGGLSVEMELQPAADVDDIPYTQDANLVLFIDLQGTFLFGTPFANQEGLVPTLEPGTSSFRLPLNEYHDPTDLSFQTDASIQITPGEQGQERFVNPGRTVVYTFDLTFEGAGEATFEATLTGRNGDWGRIIGDTVFTADGGRTLAVAVTAPEDARDGEQADLTLTIANRDNAAIQAGIGMLTTVTSSTDIPDESDYESELNGELTDDKESPGLPVALLVAALVLLVRRR
ncbi:MAG: hypothetical protein ACPHID_06545 [Thermoplasmatota archaeon]